MIKDFRVGRFWFKRTLELIRQLELYLDNVLLFRLQHVSALIIKRSCIEKIRQQETLTYKAFVLNQQMYLILHQAFCLAKQDVSSNAANMESVHWVSEF